MWGPSLTVRAPALATSAVPASRDRLVDLVRAGSIVLVVLGHYTIAAVEREGGSLHGTNALSTAPWLRAATWVFQVMPLFFFVGGFSNARALMRPSTSVPAFIGRRVERLTTPTIIFVAAWLVGAVAARLAGADSASLREGARVAAQPLWFLAVYLIAIAAAPVQFALHRRRRWVVPVAVPLLVVGVDVLRLAHVAGGAADVNYALVFVAAQELGFWYADGTLRDVSPYRLVSIAGAAVSLLVLMSTVGPYPVSMVGVPGQRLSNMSPPTVCILLLTVAQVSALMAARRPIERWLQRDRVWAVTATANGVLLTVFLWHLTAFVVAAAVFAGAGAPLPAAGSGQWWAAKPLWLLVTIAVLTVLVILASPAERKSLFAAPRGRPRAVTAWLAITLVAAGMSAIAATGFTDLLRRTGRHVLGLQVSPLIGVLLLAAGWLLAHPPRRTGHRRR